MLDQVMKGLDAIEVKIKNHAGRTEALVGELADRVLTLEQRRAQHTAPGETRRGPSLGVQVAEQIEKNRELLDKTGKLRLQIETKAATDPVSTSSGRTINTGPVGAPGARVLGIQYGLRRRPAPGLTALEYSRYTGVQGSAAQQAAEGDAKAAVRPDHSVITQSALTIAGYAKLTRQAMTDRAQLEAAVELTLRRSIDTALDVALCNGATGFTGGLEGLATAYTSLVYTPVPDAVSEAVSTMQQAGFEPDVVFLNPATWLAVCVAKGTANDHYLSGSYLGALPMEMRGLRVVLSPSIDSGKALVVDSAHVELLDVWPFEVEIAYADDDFIKNLATMRGEVRVLPVFMTAGAARFITPKA